MKERTATPAEMRKMLESVDSLKKGMVAFVPIPIIPELDGENGERLYAIFKNRITAILTHDCQGSA